MEFATVFDVDRSSCGCGATDRNGETIRKGVIIFERATVFDNDHSGNVRGATASTEAETVFKMARIIEHCTASDSEDVVISASANITRCRAWSRSCYRSIYRHERCHRTRQRYNAEGHPPAARPLAFSRCANAALSSRENHFLIPRLVIANTRRQAKKTRDRIRIRSIVSKLSTMPGSGTYSQKFVSGSFAYFGVADLSAVATRVPCRCRRGQYRPRHV